MTICLYSVTALFLHRNPGHNVKTTLIKTIVKVKVKEKQSAHSFGESVDDQQCVDNRRKADETSSLQMVSVM